MNWQTTPSMIKYQKWLINAYHFLIRKLRLTANNTKSNWYVRWMSIKMIYSLYAYVKTKQQLRISYSSFISFQWHHIFLCVNFPFEDDSLKSIISHPCGDYSLLNLSGYLKIATENIYHSLSVPFAVSANRLCLTCRSNAWIYIFLKVDNAFTQQFTQRARFTNSRYYQPLISDSLKNSARSYLCIDVLAHSFT